MDLLVLCLMPGILTNLSLAQNYLNDTRFNLSRSYTQFFDKLETILWHPTDSDHPCHMNILTISF